MHEVVTIEITSFRGSIGGEHWYGKLHVRTKYQRETLADGTERLFTRAGYGVERHPHDGYELKRRLSAKEAAHLNKKDDGGFFTSSMGLKRGDETTRFNDVESIVAAAVKAFPRVFDETDVLLRERERHSYRYEVLLGPPEVVEALGPLEDFGDMEQWLMANGYLLKEPPQEEGDAK